VLPQDERTRAWSDCVNPLTIKPADSLVTHPSLFSSISPADRSVIVSPARTKQLSHGEVLYFESDPVDQIFLITSGFVKINMLGQNGSMVIVRLCASGDLVDVADLLSGDKHCRMASALRFCRALVWDATTFKRLTERFPTLRLNLLRTFTAHLAELEERFREMATERVSLRVARQFLRLAEKIGQAQNGPVDICLSREELAQMTGTTLFTVSRLVSSWEGRGIVKTRRGGVTICDFPTLRAVAEEA
jgi:CRP-like cAMP-binding protein